MKLPKLSILLLAGIFAIKSASGQANASLNILTLNSGQVALGGTVDIQVTVGNTGPTNSILANKVRAQISVPTAICSTLPNVDQTGLPAGWTITVNTGGSITVCNGSDVIPVGAQRQIFIKVTGTSLGGPSTINGSLLFSSGTSCTVPGTLAGDMTADNTATTSIQVIPAPACGLGVSAGAGTVLCNAGTTTLTATPSGAAGTVEYSIDGTNFQSANTFTVGAGTYTVTAREVATPSCTATATPVTVTEPSAISASAAAGNAILCNGGTTSLTVTASGGTGTLEYSLDGIAYQSSNVFTVGAGSYTVTVRDANACTSTTSPVNVTEPSAVSASASVTTPPSVPGGGATVTVTGGGGTGTITYVITAGPVINTTGATSGVFTGLTAGGYTFTATDANGCTGTASATVTNPTPGPSNVSLNILTLNSGQVNTGATVDLQVTVGNTGSSFIAANKVRAQVSIPSAIATALPNADQTGLPPGWTITVNTGGSITVCNGSDAIPAGTQRQIFIKIQGTSAGGPSTINSNLLFSNGSSCTTPGTQPGDLTADNVATTSIQVNDVVMPVTLTDFDARLDNCQPVLNWVTETELNSDRFEIERSSADGHWTKIATVAASNNTTSKRTYSYVDRTLSTSAGKALYKLKMIDLDGSYKYSKVLLVLTDCKTVQAHVYPVPTKDGRLYVAITGASGRTETTLMTLSGQVIKKTTMINGTNTLNVSGVANGMYILSITNENGIDKKIKVVIQN